MSILLITNDIPLLPAPPGKKPLKRSVHSVSIILGGAIVLKLQGSKTIARIKSLSIEVSVIS